ncbi:MULTISPECIES: helix-turn-helix transcriptional regulator [unclassified Photobacterium]|uniref:helix-turn-helix domain-containing protein n=1 Tax=unclassified Photobacterium TaxID=2628852 RepID=UPI001B8CA07A|nr:MULTISPECIES: helix-turn-helix transcriptional regulator [unclassified Photobacterium]MDO6705373.1 helix-turn-helix transcriptional regulator [Photobacterium sp. 1_MG-2023]QUJ68784.1 helix-turn-helix transcriptional regulator [Photobacterium sp. GJ3]
MQYTEEDRKVLYETWMSYKAKMRVTQIEMAKKLGVSQLFFSDILRGNLPLEHRFVSQFCQYMGVDPILTIPSLREQIGGALPNTVTLTNTYIVDGNIKNVRYSGNQIVVEYEHNVTTH